MTFHSTLIRLLFICFFTFITGSFSSPAGAQVSPERPAEDGSSRRSIDTLPVYNAGDLGYQPIVIPTRQDIEGSIPFSEPDNYAVITKNGPAVLHPGGFARYALTVANYENVTRTVRLTDTLPAGLTYIPDSADELSYHPATRTLSWQGQIAPGHLDYLIEANTISLPYLDLADFGATNLCDEFIAEEGDCDDATVTFNLGVNGYTAVLYGQAMSQLTLSSNGLLLGGPGNTGGIAGVGGNLAYNQWLPSSVQPGFLLAGLWRDVDMTSGGRWHAAIITGLIEGHDVFYAQWHDAPHAADPNLTARHAIILVLGEGDVAGHTFFVYDNIADPAGTVAQGYTIGAEDRPGLRGVTYAYAPCCGDDQPPQGWPPAAGTALWLRPVLYGGGNDYQRTFTFDALVTGQPPQTIANTAYADINSPDPALQHAWSTHYLQVRWQLFLPLMSQGGQ